MAARSRGYNQTSEWDEFNNSTYDADDDGRSGVELDHCRLYVTNIPMVLNEDGLRTAFAKFGTLVRVFLSNDPNKRYAMVTFETPGEAKLAMTKLNRTEPLKLNISIAQQRSRDNDRTRDRDQNGPSRKNFDSSSVSSKKSGRKDIDLANGDNEVEEDLSMNEFDLDIVDPNVHLELELEQIKLQQLELQEQQVRCKQRMLLLKQTGKRASALSTSSNRHILPGGRIVVRNVNDRNLEPRDAEASYGAGAGDSNERDTVCSCQTTVKLSWTAISEGSTPSTCTLCSEDSQKDRTCKNQAKSSKFIGNSKKSSTNFAESKTVNSVATNDTSKKSDYTSSKFADTVSKSSDVTSERMEIENKIAKNISDSTMHVDLYCNSEDGIDETNRLIHLRNCDYMDIVDDTLKIVIALAGYPKSKMRLRQMELFQKCLTDVIDMQLKAGLLKKVPVFFDYYLNRGTIVCICKDMDTRNWLVRINPGLQERMCTNLILLKVKVKRLCLAVLKIFKSCWPASAQDVFKLLQYFNPTLNTNLWKINSQKITDNVECTSFLVDRISGEILRGPNFKNVIDYNQMDFELTGYTEIYHECLLSDSDKDLSSLASRVKLLAELKSAEDTPKIMSEVKFKKVDPSRIDTTCTDVKHSETYNQEVSDVETVEEIVDIKKELDSSLQHNILQKLKNVKVISGNEVIMWTDERNNNSIEQETEKCDKVQDQKQNAFEDKNGASLSAVANSDHTKSVNESNDDFIVRSSNFNIDSNRGIAYQRRTNYLYVENELKIAITLEGYPQNKLDGTHCRRLKNLFKEYLHKDVKQQRFSNLIIPKFQDVYLSNGAVIYICDSMETKDYLTEVFPKFINSTGLKLTFRDVKKLVRYTRVVMRLPHELAHVDSVEILLKLQATYPGLKPGCWKYYSDVAGRLKREFGVDPESLEVIKSSDFDPVYEGEKLSFRIIDRQKRDSFNESCEPETPDSKKQKEILKKMYVPIDPEIANVPLTRIRTKHYTDLIADDLKLYIGPSNYPESRIDEVLFRTIKTALENIVYESLDMQLNNQIPKFHDMYLFDGVIFVICQNEMSKLWLEDILDTVNGKLHINLKSTEFRGAVGIISMKVKTGKSTDEVISILQKQNPRLRTKYWRKISIVKSKKLDVILQIDKLSAEVIAGPGFNNFIDGKEVQFKLGHLQSLIKPKESLEELTKVYTEKRNSLETKGEGIDNTNPIKESIKINKSVPQGFKYKEAVDHSDIDPVIIDKEPTIDQPVLPDVDVGVHKITLKIPQKILPEDAKDLNVIFNLLEDKNPGFNTERWEVYTDSPYPSNGRFTVMMDKQSMRVINSKKFDSTIGGEKLKFIF